MAKIRVIIRGKTGVPIFYGRVKDGLKVAKGEKGLPEGYHINGRDSQLIPGTWYRNPERFLVFDQGNPNPIPFTGELPDCVVVAADGKTLVRSVQVGILAGPLIGKIAQDGLYSRKNPLNMDWRIMAAIACGILIMGYVVGQSGFKLW